MDGSRFDSIARALAQGMSRRRAMKTLAAAVATAVAGGQVYDDARAQSACPPGQTPNRKGDCSCPPGTAACSDGCFDLKHDVNNCGRCGRTCIGGECRRGDCRCPAGHISCGGICVDPRVDDAHCGGCDSACLPNQSCGANGRPGVCACTPATCESLGAGCGAYQDGCGNTIQCTNCPPGLVCDGVACLTANGGACVAATECASGFCTGGICCAQACDGECESCATGTCQPVSDTPCGGTGVCGGTCVAGTCLFPGESLVCDESVCSGDGLTTWRCDGAGACVSTTEGCGLYTCQNGECLTACTNHDQCTGEAFCNGGVCQGDLPTGSVCISNDQCVDGYCVGGVCCTTACTGLCESCATGSCAPVVPGTSCGPDGTCQGTCDALGVCVFPGESVICAGGTCVDGIANQPSGCDGAGTCLPPVPVECAPYVCDMSGTSCLDLCLGNDECVDGFFCDASSTCQARKAQGDPCEAPGECDSGFCVDGVCCDTACDGQCEACDFSPVGSCAPFVGVPRGNRPACTGGPATVCSGFCDGINAETCTYAAAGTVCNAGTCTGNILDAGTFCDGAGSCVPSQSPDANCSPYLCDPTLPACPASCGNDADCIAGFQCIADSGGVGRCVQPRGLGERCAEPGDCLQGFGCYQRSTGSPICCPIPGCGPCQELDATCQCVPIPGSDGQTCGSDRICCSGQCCVTDATCDAGQCSETCVGLFGTCEHDGQCCSSDLAICEAIYPSPTTKCCSILGGPCVFPGGDCCDVPGELDVSARRVFCAAEGSLTCGGVGATCSSPTLPGDLEPSRQCVSGTCCLNEAGDSGVCCDYGQECDENLRCRPRG